MNRSENIAKLAEALAKAQGSMSAAKKDCKNAHIGNKYADLASVWEACRKPLADNGLSVIQATGEIVDGKVSVETMLLHLSGEWVSSNMTMPIVQQVKGEGWKESLSPQVVGLVITYARRYALAAMVGIVQDDDDGEAGMGRPQQNAQQQQAKSPPPRQQVGSLSEKQLSRMFEIAKANNVSNDALRSIMKQKFSIDSTKSLTKAQYDELCDKLIPQASAA